MNYFCSDFDIEKEFDETQTIEKHIVRFYQHVDGEGENMIDICKERETVSNSNCTFFLLIFDNKFFFNKSVF